MALGGWKKTALINHLFSNVFQHCGSQRLLKSNHVKNQNVWLVKGSFHPKNPSVYMMNHDVTPIDIMIYNPSFIHLSSINHSQTDPHCDRSSTSSVHRAPPWPCAARRTAAAQGPGVRTLVVPLSLDRWEKPGDHPSKEHGKPGKTL